MQYRVLGRTAASVSVLGFGAAPLGGVYGHSDVEEGARAVHRAIDCGITFFDTAPYYGLTLSEERLGQALEGRRSRVFLATKCCRYGRDDFDFSAARVATSIDESLQRLRTDYVDLFQVHDVEFGDVARILQETIPAMREVQRAGKARFIGITGYPPALLARMIEAEPVDTVLSYCHYNLLTTDMDAALTPAAVRTNTGLINASPLHMGLLVDAAPPPWHPASREVREAALRVVDLCRARGRDVARTALRFALDHPYAAVTLVGIGTCEELDRNLAALDTANDPEFIAAIHNTVGAAANISWPSGRPENNLS